MPDDEELERLIDKVKANGHGEDLVTREGDSLLVVVNRKVKHPRNKKRVPFESELFDKFYTPECLYLGLYGACPYVLYTSVATLTCPCCGFPFQCTSGCTSACTSACMDLRHTSQFIADGGRLLVHALSKADARRRAVRGL